MVSAGAFERDPLRTVRVARLASELGFEVDAATAEAARSAAPGLHAVAAERIFAELKRMLVSERPVRGLELLESVGATAVVLPELLELRGVEQSHFHHLDAYDHTVEALARTAQLERDLRRCVRRRRTGGAGGARGALGRRADPGPRATPRPRSCTTSPSRRPGG